MNAADAAETPDKQILIRIPTAWHDYLRDRAHDERTSISELVRAALRSHYAELRQPAEGAKGGECRYPRPPFSASLCADRE